MESVPAHGEDPAPELFRPSKRRKFYRKRTGAEDAEDAEDAAPSPAADKPIATPEPLTVDELISRGGNDTALASQAAEEPRMSIQDILRQRKAAQRRKGGIEFTNHARTSPAPATSNVLVGKGDAEDEIPDNIKSVVSRFAPQTGQVTDDTDKHMLAYIDSEIAKLHRSKDASTSDTTTMTISGERNAALQEGRQPAALGKLHEIDLGPDATARNIVLTEAAQRRLDGEPDDSDQSKPRLLRDGKPFRRKRRTSTDIKRDKLVEEVMRESRLEIYDDEEDSGGDGGDGEADDRIAEQFRREFMDAVSSRRQRAAPTAASTKVNGKTVVAESRGPKLGGSRSARAKVRERELEEAAKGKKR